MLPNGKDFVLKNASLCETIFDIVQNAWNSCVVEYGDDCMFIYKDQEAFQSWNEEGWNSEHGHHLITLYEGDSPSCVTELPSTDPLQKQIEELLEM